jgi:hypothetical protein
MTVAHYKFSYNIKLMFIQRLATRFVVKPTLSSLRFTNINPRFFSSNEPREVPEIDPCLYNTLGVEKDANSQEVR